MKEFADEVKEWIGNSPYKATAFGAACFALGWLANIWPL